MRCGVGHGWSFNDPVLYSDNQPDKAIVGGVLGGCVASTLSSRIGLIMGHGFGPLAVASAVLSIVIGIIIWARIGFFGLAWSNLSSPRTVTP